MIEDLKRTIAYICPVCRQAVAEERSVFSLAASLAELKCPCGGSRIRISCQEDKYRLLVPCLLCGEEHTVTCSSRAFLHERALAFSCSASGLDCCYVGERVPVMAALTRLEETVDKLGQPRDGEAAFLDPMVMQEVLAELREIAGRGKIACVCGSASWKLDIGYSAVDLVCADCGAAVRLPAATVSDLEDLCCKDRILIGKIIPDGGRQQ